MTDKQRVVVLTDSETYALLNTSGEDPGRSHPLVIAARAKLRKALEGPEEEVRTQIEFVVERGACTWETLDAAKRSRAGREEQHGERDLRIESREVSTFTGPWTDIEQEGEDDA